MHALGLHKAPLHGIVTIGAPVVMSWTGNSVRCQLVASIAISGGYQDDHDTEEYVIYTGVHGWFALLLWQQLVSVVKQVYLKEF
jgi:hypothetical protein